MYFLFSANNYHEDWMFSELKPFLHPEQKVVVFPFSFNEDWISCEEDWNNCYSATTGKYYRENVAPFEAYNIELSNITFLNYFKDSPETMKNIINESDVLFFTGGLPEKAVERIERLGLKESIANHKGIKIGVSAGAMMHLSHFYVSPDKDYPELKYFDGLGTINDSAYVEVHFDSENIDQTDAVKHALENHATTVYAIGERGCLMRDPDASDFRMIGDVNVFKK